MKAVLLFFPLVQLFCTELSCLENLPSQFIKQSQDLGVDRSPSPIRSETLSLEHTPEVGGGAPEGTTPEASPSTPSHIEDGTQQQPRADEAHRTLRLSPAAKPFIPLKHLRTPIYHGSSEGNGVVTMPEAPSSRGLAPFFSHHQYMPPSELSKTRREARLRSRNNLPSNVVEGFPQAEDLQIWFTDVAKPARRDYWRRTKMLRRIASYKITFSPFHIRPVDEDKRILEEGFKHTYDFGRRALNALQKSPTELAKMSLRLKKQLIGLHAIGIHHLDNLVYLPMILAAAEEGFLHEAAIFSTYLHIFRTNAQTAQDTAEDSRQHRDVTFETLSKTRKPEVEGMGRILDGVEDEKGMDEWMKYIQGVCRDGKYYEINSRLENFCQTKLQKHITSETNYQYQTSDQNAEKSKDLENTSSHEIAREHEFTLDNQRHLLRTAMNTVESRGKHSMVYDLSIASLNYYSQKLINLVTEIAKVHEFKEYSTGKVVGELLQRVYKSEAELL